MRREKHNIESNCVTFDDDCYNETQKQDTYQTMYDYETRVVKDFTQKIYRTGESFIRDLEEKLGLRSRNTQ